MCACTWSFTQLTEAAEEGEGSVNHHADKELSAVYLLNNKNSLALKHALNEYNRRPDNIDVAETAAWAYYKNGEVKKAIPFIESALKTGSKNPALLCHAGIIYAASNNKIKAQLLLKDALRNNPNIDSKLKKESLEIIDNL